MTVENANAEEQLVDDIEVDVQEDEVVDGGSLNSENELDSYTKTVSKRINKKNQQIKAAEERAAQFESIASQREAEINALRSHQVVQNATVLQKEEEAINAKEAQANDLYKKAVESGDAELMSKADTLKSDISIQKEKVRLAKNRQPQPQAMQPQAMQPQAVDPNYYQNQQPVQQEAQVEPTEEALGWYEKNKWYGDQENEDNLQATQYAYFQHYNLINEGFEADSDEYYGELNNRIYKVYPDLKSSGGNDVKSEGRPAVQRVASTSPSGSRQQTQGKKNGVTFSKSEVDRLRGLKPHNMTEEAWLKRVALEKQKIAQREAV